MGDRKHKTWREPLDDKWVRALLHGRVPHDEKGSISAYTLLHTAREAYMDALRVAREKLAEHPLVEVAAQEAAKREGRRGHPSIVIDDNGSVVLEVHYGSKPTSSPKPKKDVSATKKSKLPTLDELRKQAEEAGVDISDLGRAKRLIMARIAEGPAAPPKPKMTKTAPAIGPVRLVSPPPPPPPKEEEEEPEPASKPKKKKSLAAMAAEGAAQADDMLDDFFASLEDIE